MSADDIDRGAEAAEAVRAADPAAGPPLGASARTGTIDGTTPSPRAAAAWRVVAEVPDPEVPAVSVVDLGIVREVIDHGASAPLELVLTPTYSGCPATEAIAQDVLAAIDAAGFGPARVTLRRAPAWTSDWISAAGREKLRACGIVPPGPASDALQPQGPAGVRGSDGGARDAPARPIHVVRRPPPAPLACPRCGSRDTERLSAFGSTACKALHRCRACAEPFEHFKPI